MDSYLDPAELRFRAAWDARCSAEAALQAVRINPAAVDDDTRDELARAWQTLGAALERIDDAEGVRWLTATRRHPMTLIAGARA